MRQLAILLFLLAPTDLLALKRGFVNQALVFVHPEPSATSSNLTVLWRNAPVEILKSEKIWTKVKAGDIIGYIPTAQISSKIGQAGQSKPTKLQMIKSNVMLTVFSIPRGATITTVGQVHGTTPLVMNVPTKGLIKGQCFSAAAIVATWPSGAHSETINGYQICAEQGEKQSISFTRPSGVDGSDLDFQYGLQLEQLDLMRQQMVLALYMNQQQQNQANYQAQQNRMQQYLLSIQNTFRRSQDTLHCTSRVSLGTIYTDCQ